MAPSRKQSRALEGSNGWPGVTSPMAMLGSPQNESIGAQKSYGGTNEWSRRFSSAVA